MGPYVVGSITFTSKTPLSDNLSALSVTLGGNTVINGGKKTNT